jgi:6-phosphogluconolactonase
MPMPRRDGASLPAGMMAFRIAEDGRLSFARKYDVEVAASHQFWTGMLALP